MFITRNDRTCNSDIMALPFQILRFFNAIAMAIMATSYLFEILLNILEKDRFIEVDVLQTGNRGLDLVQMSLCTIALLLWCYAAYKNSSTTLLVIALLQFTLILGWFFGADDEREREELVWRLTIRLVVVITATVQGIALKGNLMSTSEIQHNQWATARVDRLRHPDEPLTLQRDEVRRTSLEWLFTATCERGEER